MYVISHVVLFICKYCFLTQTIYIEIKGLTHVSLCFKICSILCDGWLRAQAPTSAIMRDSADVKTKKKRA